MKKIRVITNNGLVLAGEHEEIAVLNYYTKHGIECLIARGDFEYIEEEKSLAEKFEESWCDKVGVSFIGGDICDMLVKIAHQHEKKLHIEAFKKEREKHTDCDYGTLQIVNKLYLALEQA